MIATHNTVVSLTYTLRRDNAQGDLIEAVQAAEPFVFLFGGGSLLPDFEQNLRGKQMGEPFEFSIPAARAYGDRDPEALVTLQRQAFMQDGVDMAASFEVGDQLPMQDQDGNQFEGTVRAITDAAVTMDFNHPLAGQDLHFSGIVLHVRMATPEEVAHRHVHGPDGHHHH